MATLTLSPVRKGAFQHPDLIAYGEKLCEGYETSIMEARHGVACGRSNRWYNRLQDLISVQEKHGKTNVLTQAQDHAHAQAVKSEAEAARLSKELWG